MRLLCLVLALCVLVGSWSTCEEGEGGVLLLYPSRVDLDDPGNYEGCRDYPYGGGVYLGVPAKSLAGTGLDWSLGWGIAITGANSVDDYRVAADAIKAVGAVRVSMPIGSEGPNQFVAEGFAYLLERCDALKALSLNLAGDLPDGLFEELTKHNNIESLFFVYTQPESETLINGLGMLSKIKGLRSLTLYTPRSEVIASLPALDALESLFVWIEDVENPYVQKLPILYPTLKEFSCVLPITADLSKLPKFPLLTELSVSAAEGFQPRDSAGFVGIPEFLEKHSSLERLSLQGVPESAVASIGGVNGLKSLSLVPAYAFDDAIWSNLAGLRNLEEVNIHMVTVGDTIASMLSALPKLTNFFTMGTRSSLTEKGRKALASITSLKHMHIRTPVSDMRSHRLLEYFSGCTELETLVFSGYLTEADASVISRSNVRYLEINSMAFDDSAMLKIAQCKNLSELALKYAYNLTEAGVTALAGCPRLRELQLAYAPYVSAEAIARVLAARKLRSLKLEHMAFDGSSIPPQARPVFFEVGSADIGALMPRNMSSQEYLLGLVIDDMSRVRIDGKLPPSGGFPEGLFKAFVGYRWLWFSNSSTGDAKDATKFVLIAYPLQITGGTEIYYLDEELAPMAMQVTSDAEIARFAKLTNSDIRFDEDTRIPWAAFEPIEIERW